MGLLAALGLTSPARAVERDRGFELYRGGVDTSEDLERIIALPRRPRPDDTQQLLMAEAMTARLARENSACVCQTLSNEPCIRTLLPIQGWYLWEASRVGGALGHIVAGGGKTGIDILLAMVVPGIRRAAVLIPPSLRAQFALDFERWAQHFHVPNLAGGKGPFVPGRPVLDVIAYSQLGRANFTEWFSTHRPDIVIGDEAQALKDVQSVRGSRFVRHFVDHEDARTFLHSGSMTTRGLGDYSHLSALALREGSPLPLESAVVKEWAEAIDPPPHPSMDKAPPGALRRLCAEGEEVEEGFRRRLVETAGVITTQDAELPTRLRLCEREGVAVPTEALPAAVLKSLSLPEGTSLADLLKQVRERERRPDGEWLVEKIEVAACCRQLASGFFYRWKYPRGEPEELILKWLGCRAAWHKELRDRLEHRSAQLDSPELLTNAARRFYGQDTSEGPRWAAGCWPAWNEIADKVQPVQETVWLSDFLALDAVAWGKEAPGVIWYQDSAWGKRVAELGGFKRYGGGDDASEQIKREDGKRTVVASIKAHGTGKNLQMFSRALVGNPPGDGGAWEQLLARHHRKHQRAAQVEFQVYRHTPEFCTALDKAREFARYTQSTTGKAERLLQAQVDFWKQFPYSDQ